MDWDLIYSYSNDDALNDGVFIEISQFVSEPLLDLVGIDRRVLVTQGVKELIGELTEEGVLALLFNVQNALWDEGMASFKYMKIKVWAFDEPDCIKICLPEER